MFLLKDFYHDLLKVYDLDFGKKWEGLRFLKRFSLPLEVSS